MNWPLTRGGGGLSQGRARNRLVCAGTLLDSQQHLGWWISHLIDLLICLCPEVPPAFLSSRGWS